MNRNGYDPYRGRSRFRTFLKALIVLLLVLLVLSVAALFWLEPCIDYSAGGIRIHLPFSQPQEPEETGAQVVVTTPEASPTPTPLAEAEFRAVLLPNTALYDGTAAERLSQAGANAAVFDMKADDGSLGYLSQLELPLRAGLNPEDPSLNAAIQLLGEGDMYTVARVSCFRDNTAPRYENGQAIHVSGGNWRDSDGCRWLSPASAEARQYVAGVCQELAALGFDEILLENWSFPIGGERILSDGNYPADALSSQVEAFLAEVRSALAGYPEVRLSLATTAAAASGGAPESGQTTALLEAADRVAVSLAAGERLPDLGDTPVVPVLAQPGEADSNWIVLPESPEF